MSLHISRMWRFSSFLGCALCILHYTFGCIDENVFDLFLSRIFLTYSQSVTAILGEVSASIWSHITFRHVVSLLRTQKLNDKRLQVYTAVHSVVNLFDLASSDQRDCHLRYVFTLLSKKTVYRILSDWRVLERDNIQRIQT